MKFAVIINTERCKGCRLCVSVCPQTLLHMSTTINRKGYTFPIMDVPKPCIGCRQCAEICPDAAIEIEGT